MHPQVIILGGGLSLLGERLRAAVDAALQGFIMEAFGRGPGIALATLQEDAVPVGALLLARSAASPR
jgi:glucokinase